MQIRMRRLAKNGGFTDVCAPRALFDRQSLVHWHRLNSISIQIATRSKKFALCWKRNWICVVGLLITLRLIFDICKWLRDRKSFEICFSNKFAARLWSFLIEWWNDFLVVWRRCLFVLFPGKSTIRWGFSTPCRAESLKNDKRSPQEIWIWENFGYLGRHREVVKPQTKHDLNQATSGEKKLLNDITKTFTLTAKLQIEL